MKPRLILIILLSALTTSLFAQSMWGTRTGIQSSTLHFSKASEWAGWKVAYLIPGVYVEHPIGEKFSISTELQFANKGFKWKGNLLYGGLVAGTGSHNYNMPYIVFPVLAQFRLAEQISVYAGPELGVKLNSSIVIDGERIVDNSVFTRPFDFGIKSGLSYHITKKYQLNFGYTHGLSNVIGKDVEVFDDLGNALGNARSLGYKFTNRVFSVSFSSAFSLPDNDQVSNIWRAVSFGFRQGISTYTLYGSGVNLIDQNGLSQKARIGYEAGVELHVDLFKHLYLTTGFNLSYKGGQLGADDPVKAKYVSIPILIGVSPIKTNLLAISIEGGVGLNRQIQLVNPYQDYLLPLYEGSNYPNTGGFIYGFEVSTDAVKNLTLFLSYRNIWDESRFFELESQQLKNSYEFVNRGQSFSLGVRLKRVKPKESIDTFASDEYGNESGVRIKAGGNFTHTELKNGPSNVENSMQEFGVNSGFSFKIRLGTRFSFIPELQYTIRQEHLNAIENPLMLSYALGRHTSIESGVQWGILLKRGERLTSGYQENIAKPLDIGLSAGMMYRVGRKVNLGIRYYHGMTDIYSLYQNGVQIPASGFSRSFLVSTYYTLSSVK